LQECHSQASCCLSSGPTSPLSMKHVHEN
jgi:hypothetical protein